MQHDLADEEMDELLSRLMYGHIGCILPDGRVYVVPVTYAYHDGAIYSFSYAGKKIDAMRKDHSVCFQVQEFIDENSWKSVILWGKYEELSGHDAFVANKALFDRLTLENGAPISALYLRSADMHGQNGSVFYRQS